jgi:hypothetical protein
MDWSMKRVDPVNAANDPPQPTCAVCLNQFKHLKEYCPICYKRYDQAFLPGKIDVHVQKAGYLAEPESENLREMLLSMTERWGCKFMKVAEDKACESSSASQVASMHSSSDMAVDDCMIQCNECQRWIHAICEGVDQAQFEAMAVGSHPVWGKEYLCPICRVDVSLKVVLVLSDNYEAGLGIFAEPVSESLAKNYYDIIRNPMDLSTMRSKAGRGQYKSLQSLRQDFEQMCLNAFTFNIAGDEYWTETRRFYELSLQNIFSALQSTQPTRFGVEMKELEEAYHLEVKKAAKLEDPANKKQKRGPADPNLNVYQIEYKKPCTARRRHNDAPESALELSESYLSSKTLVSSTPQPGDQGNPTPSDDTAGDGKISAETALLTDSQNDGLSAEEISPDSMIYTFVLPKQLSEASDVDPAQFMSGMTFAISQDDALYCSYQDTCFVCACGSSTQCGDNFFLFCVDCGECFHSYCVAAPVATMTAEKRVCWRCPNCKVTSSRAFCLLYFHVVKYTDM